MTRNVVQMQAETLKLKNSLGSMATILSHQDAPQPILPPIKRDMILAPRMNNDTGAQATFTRIIASVSPHPDYKPPLLWADPTALQETAQFSWPPERKAAP